MPKKTVNKPRIERISSMDEYYAKYFPGNQVGKKTTEQEPSGVGKQLAKEARDILKKVLSPTPI
jgi:hypothetical protein